MAIRRMWNPDGASVPATVMSPQPAPVPRVTEFRRCPTVPAVFSEVPGFRLRRLGPCSGFCFKGLSRLPLQNLN